MAKRAEIFARLRAENPAPTTELDFGTPFELLVAVMLSAQATDVSVNQATATLFAEANTPAALLDLGLDRLKGHIKSIGLFNTKAANVLKTCRLLLDEHGGDVPKSREALEALPGVGRKTANVVLNTAFGESTIAVDTHIFRVCNRTRLAPGKTPRQVEEKLLRWGAGGLQARRPPLAHPPRPLRLHRPQAPLRRLPNRRPLRIQGQDGVRRLMTSARRFARPLIYTFPLFPIHA